MSNNFHQNQFDQNNTSNENQESFGNTEYLNNQDSFSNQNHYNSGNNYLNNPQGDYLPNQEHYRGQQGEFSYNQNNYQHHHQQQKNFNTLDAQNQHYQNSVNAPYNNQQTFEHGDNYNQQHDYQNQDNFHKQQEYDTQDNFASVEDAMKNPQVTSNSSNFNEQQQNNQQFSQQYQQFPQQTSTDPDFKHGSQFPSFSGYSKGGESTQNNQQNQQQYSNYAFPATSGGLTNLAAPNAEFAVPTLNPPTTDFRRTSTYSNISSTSQPPPIGDERRASVIEIGGYGSADHPAIRRKSSPTAKKLSRLAPTPNGVSPPRLFGFQDGTIHNNGDSLGLSYSSPETFSTDLNPKYNETIYNTTHFSPTQLPSQPYTTHANEIPFSKGSQSVPQPFDYKNINEPVSDFPNSQILGNSINSQNQTQGNSPTIQQLSHPGIPLSPTIQQVHYAQASPISPVPISPLLIQQQQYFQENFNDNNDFSSQQPTQEQFSNHYNYATPQVKKNAVLNEGELVNNQDINERKQSMAFTEGEAQFIDPEGGSSNDDWRNSIAPEQTVPTSDINGHLNFAENSQMQFVNVNLANQGDISVQNSVYENNNKVVASVPPLDSADFLHSSVGTQNYPQSVTTNFDWIIPFSRDYYSNPTSEEKLVSIPFSSDIYRIQAVVFPKGVGLGKDTHLSLFFRPIKNSDEVSLGTQWRRQISSISVGLMNYDHSSGQRECVMQISYGRDHEIGIIGFDGESSTGFGQETFLAIEDVYSAIETDETLHFQISVVVEDEIKINTMEQHFPNPFIGVNLLEVNSCFTLPVFGSEDQKWQLLIYPDGGGVDEYGSKISSIYLKPIKNTLEVAMKENWLRILTGLTVKIYRGEQFFLIASKIFTGSFIFKYEFNETNPDFSLLCGWSAFVSLDELLFTEEQYYISVSIVTDDKANSDHYFYPLCNSIKNLATTSASLLTERETLNSKLQKALSEKIDAINEKSKFEKEVSRLEAINSILLQQLEEIKVKVLEWEEIVEETKKEVIVSKKEVEQKLNEIHAMKTRIAKAKMSMNSLRALMEENFTATAEAGVGTDVVTEEEDVESWEHLSDDLDLKSLSATEKVSELAMKGVASKKKLLTKTLLQQQSSVLKSEYLKLKAKLSALDFEVVELKNNLELKSTENQNLRWELDHLKSLPKPATVSKMDFTSTDDMYNDSESESGNPNIVEQMSSLVIGAKDAIEKAKSRASNFSDPGSRILDLASVAADLATVQAELEIARIPFIDIVAKTKAASSDPTQNLEFSEKEKQNIEVISSELEAVRKSLLDTLYNVGVQESNPGSAWSLANNYTGSRDLIGSQHLDNELSSEQKRKVILDSYEYKSLQKENLLITEKINALTEKFNKINELISVSNEHNNHKDETSENEIIFPTTTTHLNSTNFQNKPPVDSVAPNLQPAGDTFRTTAQVVNEETPLISQKIPLFIPPPAKIIAPPPMNSEFNHYRLSSDKALSPEKAAIGNTSRPGRLSITTTFDSSVPTLQHFGAGSDYQQFEKWEISKGKNVKVFETEDKTQKPSKSIFVFFCSVFILTLTIIFTLKYFCSVNNLRTLTLINDATKETILSYCLNFKIKESLSFLQGLSATTLETVMFGISRTVTITKLSGTGYFKLQKVLFLSNVNNTNNKVDLEVSFNENENNDKINIPYYGLTSDQSKSKLTTKLDAKIDSSQTSIVSSTFTVEKIVESPKIPFRKPKKATPVSKKENSNSSLTQNSATSPSSSAQSNENVETSTSEIKELPKLNSISIKKSNPVETVKLEHTPEVTRNEIKNEMNDEKVKMESDKDEDAIRTDEKSVNSKKDKGDVENLKTDDKKEKITSVVGLPEVVVEDSTQPVSEKENNINEDLDLTVDEAVKSNNDETETLDVTTTSTTITPEVAPPFSLESAKTPSTENFNNENTNLPENEEKSEVTSFSPTNLSSETFLTSKKESILEPSFTPITNEMKAKSIVKEPIVDDLRKLKKNLESEIPNVNKKT
ncbi:hypothetical protein HK099_007681, partial [Clydaea vesicula]